MDNNIIKAINKYYTYKKKYEDERNNKKQKIVNNLNLSTKEKREKVKQISQPCIFCNKSSGTLFSKQKDTLLAKCGDLENPCDKFIEINTVIHINLKKVIEYIKSEIDSYIEEIINCKTKLLLNVDDKDTILNNFEEYSTLYDDTNEIYLRLKAKLNSLSSLSDNDDDIKLLNTQLEDHIKSIKILIQKYKNNSIKDDKIITETNEIYIQHIMPLEKQINDLKYKFQSINNIDNFNYYHTSNYNFKDLDIVYDVDDPKIIKFDI
jgi:hypothetical protein